MTTPPKPVGPGHNRPDLRCNHLVLYGLTCAQYEAMRARAAGHCEICKIDETLTGRGFLVVDHFHGRARGASFIRGLLCDWCNNSVMQAYDGLKAWGANRRYEEAAREYERNSWQQPSAAARAEMSLRVEVPSKKVPPKSVRLSLLTSDEAMAMRLLDVLGAERAGRLARLIAATGSGE